MPITNIQHIDPELDNLISDFLFSLRYLLKNNNYFFSISNNVIDLTYAYGQSELLKEDHILIRTKHHAHINLSLYLPAQSIEPYLQLHLKNELECLRKLIELRLQLFYKEQWQRQCAYWSVKLSSDLSIEKLFMASLNYLNSFVDLSLETIIYTDLRRKKKIIAGQNLDELIIKAIESNIQQLAQIEQKPNVYKRVGNYFVYARISSLNCIYLVFAQEVHPVYHLALCLFINELLWLVNANNLLRHSEETLHHLSTAFINSLEARDPYTRGHSLGVKHYSLLIGQALGLNQAELSQLSMAALLHDIGKIAIPDYILLKPGRLSQAEYEIIKLHSVVGAELIASIPDLSPLAPIIKHHHERFDGQGYPEGLKGEQIPLLARIISIADVYDAILNKRVYHEPKNKLDALAILEQNAGSQFDPHLIAIALPEFKKHPIFTPKNKQKIPASLELARSEFFTKNKITGAKNQQALVEDAKVFELEVYFAGIRIRNFEYFNITLGKDKTNTLIRKLYDALVKEFDEEVVYQISPARFIIVWPYTWKKSRLLKHIHQVQTQLQFKIDFFLLREKFSAHKINTVLKEINIVDENYKILHTTFKTLSRLFREVVVVDKDYNLVYKKKMEQSKLQAILNREFKLHSIYNFGQIIGYVYYDNFYNI